MSKELEQQINNRFNRIEHLLGAAQETQIQLGRLIEQRRAIYKLIKKPKKREKKEGEKDE